MAPRDIRAIAAASVEGSLDRTGVDISLIDFENTVMEVERDLSLGNNHELLTTMIGGY